MNNKLAILINRGLEQGLTPLALAARIEKVFAMIERPATYRCVDCEKPLEVIQQGSHTVVTCKHKDCTLYGVTLSTDQYASLTPLQLEGYRKMVQQFKERNRD